MRTESPPTVASTAKRILNRLAMARHSVWARRPVVRWFAVLGCVAALGGLGYLAAIPSPGKNLGEGRQYSADDINRITRALDVAHIEYGVENRRVGVATDRYEAAMDVVSKLELDHRSIPEIRKAAQVSGLWDTMREKDQRELRAKAEILESIIGNLDDQIISAYVEILRVPVKTGARPTTNTSAFVMLETKDSREIGAKTVQSIKGIIVAQEPTLKPDAVAVWDRKGHSYLDPSNPALDEISRIRAREEELAQEVLDQLDWINGAQVTVQLVAAPAPEPEPVAVAVVKASEPDPATEPQVGVNQPLNPEAEPAPAEVPAPAAEPEPPAKRDYARIWVKVPRSYYYLKALPNHNPSPEDRQLIQERTEAVIKTAAGYVLPAGTFEVAVTTIADDLVLRDPQVAPALPETRRLPSWWIPAGVGGGVAALFLIVGLRMLATRRPRRAVAAEPARVRFTAEATPASGPGASERVRELIRHNPEAAASVLHRWIGQGGHAA